MVHNNTSHTMHHICSDCGGSRVVWTRDGDVVCTGCGLVLEAHYIDDRPERRFFSGDGDDGGDDPCRTERLIENVDPKEQAVKRMIDHILPSEDTPLKEETMKQLKSHTRKEIHVVAACFYKASESLGRGFTAQQVCNMFGVNTKAFWACFDKSGCSRHMRSCEAPLAVCKRMVAGLEGSFEWFDRKHRQPVIKVMRQLLEVDGCGSLKSSKFHASVLCIACKITGVPLVLSDVSKMFDVSIKTIHKHEALLQEGLTKKNKSSI